MVEIGRVTILSVWMLLPDLVLLLNALRQNDYVTAPIRPTHDGYDLATLERPNVIAAKGPVRIHVDFNRRTLGIESHSSEAVLKAFADVERIIEQSGLDLSSNPLFYEVQVRARVSDFPSPMRTIETTSITDFRLLQVPSLFVMADGDPNSDRWLDLRLTPIWTLWPNEEKRLFDLVLVYRDAKDRLMGFLENMQTKLDELLDMISKQSAGGRNASN